jgi:hypothetical protein
MITTAAGPQGVFHAGTTVDVPERLARAWVAGHAAVPVETAMFHPAEATVLPRAETAVVSPTEMRTEDVDTPENPGDLVPGFGKYHNGEYKEKPLTLAQIKAQDPEYLEYLANKQEKDPLIAAAAKAVLAGA